MLLLGTLPVVISQLLDRAELAAQWKGWSAHRGVIWASDDSQIRLLRRRGLE